MKAEQIRNNVGIICPPQLLLGQANRQAHLSFKGLHGGHCETCDAFRALEGHPLSSYTSLIQPIQKTHLLHFMQATSTVKVSGGTRGSLISNTRNVLQRNYHKQ